nr:hypothetical protein [Cressdnaviricota sp.]
MRHFFEWCARIYVVALDFLSPRQVFRSCYPIFKFKRWLFSNGCLTVIRYLNFENVIDSFLDMVDIFIGVRLKIL